MFIKLDHDIPQNVYLFLYQINSDTSLWNTEQMGESYRKEATAESLQNEFVCELKALLKTGLTLTLSSTCITSRISLKAHQTFFTINFGYNDHAQNGQQVVLIAKTFYGGLHSGLV